MLTRRIIGPKVSLISNSHYQAGANLSNNIEVDNYINRVVKLIPAELVGLFLTLENILKSSSETTLLIHWLVFIIILILTPLYSFKITKLDGFNTATKQIIFTSVAFIIWAFSIGGPFAYYSFYRSLYGAILLPLYSAVISA